MTRFTSILTIVTAALLPPAAAFAEDEATSLSYISYVERYATLRPAASKDSLDVVVNMPILAGDRLVTARGARVEVVLADGTTVWLDQFATLDFDALAFSRDKPAPRSVLYLADGTVALELPAEGLGDQSLRLDTPAGSLFLQRPGLYRLDLDGRRLTVQAFAGLAELPAGAGSTLLRGGQQAYLEGEAWSTRTLFEPRDEFWRWVSERRRPAAPSRTAEQVGSRVASRAAILDSYGDWVYIDTYWAWRPRVAVGWVPYSYGRWYWTPVGWTWISYEPWGWYPYHYGSWTYHPRHGWVWCWDWVWGPAWVYWFYSGSYIGWCPRGYYDYWYWNTYWHRYGPHFPHRWSQISLDFRGRIFLSDIDLRPWTVVPTRAFVEARLDRVRLAPERLRQELPRTPAYVRSGPLLTRELHPDPDSFAWEFQRGLREDNVPDLTRVLRREEGAGTGREPLPGVRMLPTRELVRTAGRIEPTDETQPGGLSRGGVGRTSRDSEWHREGGELPSRSLPPALGDRPSSSGEGIRNPVRRPERADPGRGEGEPPAAGDAPSSSYRAPERVNQRWRAPDSSAPAEQPRAPGRAVERPYPDRPRGEPSAPPAGSAGEDRRRVPERSAPPAVRPPVDSRPSQPDRSSPPPPVRPARESVRPAPPPPQGPESPPPMGHRSYHYDPAPGSGESAGTEFSTVRSRPRAFERPSGVSSGRWREAGVFSSQLRAEQEPAPAAPVRAPAAVPDVPRSSAPPPRYAPAQAPAPRTRSETKTLSPPLRALRPDAPHRPEVQDW